MAEHTTTRDTASEFSAAAYGADGSAREPVGLPPELFDGTVNLPVLHQAVKAYLANQRQGNASTKTRGLVIGGNRKPWKQKGTGRARQGSTRAPNWVGGGTVFGPQPRSYAQYVPRQVRALARKSAFNARARESAVYVVDGLTFDAPKTSRLQQLLAQLGVADRKVLLLTDGVKPNVFLSGRNLPLTHVMPYADVSAYHILWSDVVVIEGGAIGQGPAAPAADAAARSGGTVARPRAASKAATKRSAKPAAKKAAATTSSRKTSSAAAKRGGATKSAGSGSAGRAARKTANKAAAKTRAPRKEK